MNGTEVLDVGRDALWLTIQLCAPVLGVGLVVGVVIGLFQALTQIQEQTLVYAPKIIAIFLSLLLFLPWFLLLGSLYWLFPRQPRTARRRLFDGTTLVLAFALSIVSMLWGYRIGVVQPGAGPIWPQVLAVLYAYGAFLAVLVLALLLRPRWLDR